MSVVGVDDVAVRGRADASGKVGSDSAGEGPVCQRGEPWRSRHNPRLRLLLFGSLLRVFTSGQAVRYLGSGAGEGRTTLKLLEEERLVGSVEVRMPRECGGGRARVYYLTGRCLREVRRVSPEVAEHARAGRPAISARSRIPHDLLVTEAYLHVHGRAVVHDFLPESALRATLLRERATPGGLLRASRAEGVGDFRVLAERRGGNVGARWVECEVALRLDADQIARKPKGLVWFVASRRKADTVEAERGERVYLLGDVRAPFGDETRDRRGREPTARRVGCRPMTALRARVVRALGDLGGAATAAAAAAVLGLERSGVSRCLSRMAREGLLRAESVHYRPGRDLGRPPQLFARASSGALTLDARTRQLALCDLVTTLAGAGLRVTAHAGAFWTLLAGDGREGAAPQLVALVDDPSKGVRELVPEIAEARSRHCGRETILAVMMARDGRMAELRGLEPGVEIRDVRRPLGGAQDEGEDVAEAA